MDFELLERRLELNPAVVVRRRELLERVLEALRRLLEPLLLVQRVAVVQQLAHEDQSRQFGLAERR